MEQYPSIFNDVIGPVMVGPSSSHTAASVRIGRMVRQLAAGLPREVVFRFDEQGSLAHTYQTQGVDRGLLAGLLGFDTASPAIANALAEAQATGLCASFLCGSFGHEHPNTYEIEGMGADGRAFDLQAVSTGGGMFEITRCMGFDLSITGGFYEALVLGGPEDGRPQGLPAGALADTYTQGDQWLMHIRASRPFELAVAAGFAGRVIRLEPVLPVSSQTKPRVPFETAAAALEGTGDAAQLAVQYEAARGGLSDAAVERRMMDIMEVLERSLQAPPKAGGEVLPIQSHLLAARPLPGGELVGRVSQYVTRFMEIKAGMGVYVAAPTGGACGCLPGTVFALGEALGASTRDLARAMLAGGLVGVFIARHSTFAAEVAGCQAECGSGAGMCAGACVQLLGGTAQQAMDAASMALQNVLGMVCDPVAGRVEVPCLGKNILCALGGLSAAQMAMCGFDAVIPLDETIAAMDAVGRAIPRELRCTGLGGLSATPTARALERRLAGEA